jgi:hypothetical protein
MDPDGMSYIEMASRAAQHGPGELVNGYWSPAYPGLIALAYWAVHPSPDLEFPLVHFVNFLIFAFTLAAFNFLVKSWPLKDETAVSAKVT